MRIADLDIGGTSIKSEIWGGEWASGLKEWDTCASQGGKCLMERVKMILHIKNLMRLRNTGMRFPMWVSDAGSHREKGCRG